MKWFKVVFEKLNNRFGNSIISPILRAAEGFFLGESNKSLEGPFIYDKVDLKRLMSILIIALLPLLVFGVWNNGRLSGEDALLLQFLSGSKIVLPIVFVSYLVGGFWEVLFAIIRKHEISEGFLITGLVFALTLPPTTPLWMVALGITFGVVIGKEVFGGTGKNIVNPALIGRLFLFLSYPAYMTGEVWSVDVTTSATPLVSNAATLRELFIGTVAGSIGETSKILIIISGLVIILLHIASARIVFSSIISFVLSAYFLGENILWQLCSGGFLFGVFFMATDPVTAPLDSKSKIIYGVGIGFITMFIRKFNLAYQEGVMLAIILMNLLSPLLDYISLEMYKMRRKNAKVS
ncbi:MAG: RnfABCDGE type electron transport complex subunit D [Lentisphaeria bacterium]